MGLGLALIVVIGAQHFVSLGSLIFSRLFTSLSSENWNSWNVTGKGSDPWYNDKGRSKRGYEAAVAKAKLSDFWLGKREFSLIVLWHHSDGTANVPQFCSGNLSYYELHTREMPGLWVHELGGGVGLSALDVVNGMAC